MAAGAAWGILAMQLATAAPNVLLILADDMGVEALSVYELADASPTTATIDRLAGEGVVFRNFWSQPVCSPTRATIMTGRFGFRTGVGRPVAPAADGGGSGPLPPPPAKPANAPYESPGMGRFAGSPVSRGLRISEVMLPAALKAGTGGAYRTAAVGKWHVADAQNGWLDHPRHAGMDYFSVIMHGEDSFFAWRKNLNGEVVPTARYGTYDRTETAIRWIEEQGEEPWFMWLSFILPHTPLHLPPEELLQSDYSDLSSAADKPGEPVRYFHAMIEAMDTAIGRVLDSMDPAVRANTYVIFMGDNGTAGVAIEPPFHPQRAKGTVYQGGVNVPLIVTGPDVMPGVSEALVNSVDLFATILEMAGTSTADALPDTIGLDSVSFLPLLSNPAAASLRDWVYADVFTGSFSGVADADYAIRNDRHKLVRRDGEFELYDLIADPYESEDLLDPRASGALHTSGQEIEQYALLKSEAEALRTSASSAGRYTVSQ